MDIIEVLLIAFAMSVDAFSVALGIGCGRSNRLTGIKLAVAFGIFQFIMPLWGAFLGTALDKYFSGVEYLAAAILFFIAFKMFRDARTKTVECVESDPTKGFGIIVLSFATSMDAFGIGIPISIMEMNTCMIAAIIGVICFFITWLGFYLGRIYVNYVNRAEYLGAAVLAGIGVKMLLF